MHTVHIASTNKGFDHRNQRSIKIFPEEKHKQTKETRAQLTITMQRINNHQETKAKGKSSMHALSHTDTHTNPKYTCT